MERLQTLDIQRISSTEDGHGVYTHLLLCDQNHEIYLSLWQVPPNNPPKRGTP